MSKNKEKAVVVVPTPKAILNGSNIEITGDKGLYQVLICVLDEGRAVTQVLRVKLLAQDGSTNLVGTNLLTWNEQMVPGRTYTISVRGVGEDDDNASTESAMVKWTIPQLPPPADNTPAKDGGSKSPAPKPVDPVGGLESIIVLLDKALSVYDDHDELPAWMDSVRLKEMGDIAKKIVQENPGNKEVCELGAKILEKGRLIETALPPIPTPKPPTSPASLPPAPPVPTPKPPMLKPAEVPPRDQDDDGRIPIVSRVEKLEKRADQTDKDLHAVGSLAAKGIDELTQAIAGLRPATTPAGASGNGGNSGGSGASGGGKPSAEQPWKLGGSWLGVIVTLAILLVIGLIVLCAFQAGWIHKSPVVGATYTEVTPPITVVVTNTVTPVTPPLQAVQSTTASSPEEIANIADEIKAIRAGQAEFLRKEGGYSANGTQPKGGRVPTIAVGDNSIVAGRDVTVVNHNYSSLPPGKPVEEVSSGPTVTPSANATSGTFGVFTEIRSSNIRQEFPVDPALFELEFNRRIGMPDRWRYHY